MKFGVFLVIMMVLAATAVVAQWRRTTAPVNAPPLEPTRIGHPSQAITANVGTVRMDAIKARAKMYQPVNLKEEPAQVATWPKMKVKEVGRRAASGVGPITGRTGQLQMRAPKPLPVLAHRPIASSGYRRSQQ